MSLQYGQYNPRGPLVPLGFCNVATDLQTIVNGNVVRFQWKKPHDVLYFILKITEVVGNVALPPINVNGTAYVLQLDPNKSYTWTVQGFTGGVVCPQPVALGFNTGAAVTVCVPVNI